MNPAHPRPLEAPSRTAARRSAAGTRCGATLVWFAMLFIVLLGMVGLVIDSGLLLAAHRQAQNAADAAATAAATDLLNGKSDDQARATAITFVKVYNGIPATAPDPVVNIPPASGPYQGEPGYVEVVVSNPVRALFIHLLPGVSAENTVRARAVGGFEPITAGAGVAVLNPYVTGLTVGGQATLWVEGTVLVNSEGKGVDANGDPVGTGENYYAARAGNSSPAYATKFMVVGGVDWPENFRNAVPDSTDPVLFCGQLPVPDPLLNLPTPVAGTGNGSNTAGGVVDLDRGAPVATNNNLMPNDPTDPTDPNGVNKVLSPGDADFDDSLFSGQPYMLLHPGIYTSIEITGGNVYLKPGIYVIRPEANVQNALKITGGSVIARGIMFYNTGHNYDPTNGTPDVNDGNHRPPKWGGPAWEIPEPEFGSITINAGMMFSPIDTEDPELDYGDVVPDEIFNGMLFYQRRRETQGLDIQGNAAEGTLSGTLYAKWAPVKLAGQGTYDAQFVVGSFEVTGSGVVTIDYAGKKLGKAPQVFLVE